ncbi:hypothetical protein [Nostoc flagelliforme]|uniref:hypothetical protein n=1 Tax=Nostoc flagelliforme TaxID=1306274 RepID=UPI0012FE463D|nr:hypothetical protein [Nostoc flagelliforme]
MHDAFRKGSFLPNASLKVWTSSILTKQLSAIAFCVQQIKSSIQSIVGHLRAVEQIYLGKRLQTPRSLPLIRCILILRLAFSVRIR